MSILIVESETERAEIWADHLRRAGHDVVTANNRADAVSRIENESLNIVILNIVLPDGGALDLADLVGYRQPKARIMFVSPDSFFSDGSIFSLSSSACCYVRPHTPPADITAMVDHYARLAS